MRQAGGDIPASEQGSRCPRGPQHFSAMGQGCFVTLMKVVYACTSHSQMYALHLAGRKCLFLISFQLPSNADCSVPVAEHLGVCCSVLSANFTAMFLLSGRFLIKIVGAGPIFWRTPVRNTCSVVSASNCLSDRQSASNPFSACRVDFVSF